MVRKTMSKQSLEFINLNFKRVCDTTNPKMVSKKPLLYQEIRIIRTFNLIILDDLQNTPQMNAKL